jgi:hypothetical protein
VTSDKKGVTFNPGILRDPSHARSHEERVERGKRGVKEAYPE